ncbi:MAG: hypothetical protein OFPI_40260 [Osedax symbiont Rs2]|nr:MAG: hypothetical protein OFPI_40260 [Osedax symbiont Rs2]
MLYPCLIGICGRNGPNFIKSSSRHRVWLTLDWVCLIFV